MPPRTEREREDLRSAAYLNGEDVVLDPGPLVDHVLDGDSAVGQSLGQLGDSAGPIRHGDCELDEAAVGRQTSLQATAQDGGVDIAATQRNDHSKNNKNQQKQGLNI